ncbi:family 5 glycoside hydrolase [Melampsora larici-populina 98AG31]|uniref:Family 5 glycoside hydrolase n=1 Tax=Melampsora larici-populina (strain 98AG31 / pathotype 3-4-7) TaxID=747676 RepID=F4RCL7_MELLP|nr:family 5 glycoside hydrolase [Melampsora larici-populina 98AG31]EGG09755.1 family 5 glycoside hydrolase [Melampsora larici-populina 98AG31]
MHLLQATPILLWAAFFLSFEISITTQSLWSDISSDIFGTQNEFSGDQTDTAPADTAIRSQDSDSSEGTTPIIDSREKYTAASTNTGFEYGKDKIRGVNIGGWLVTESWLTPTLYRTGNSKIVDEYTFCQYLGREEASKRLRAHWDSFYTESDFQAMKSYGLNHVRIPIGYWAFDISGGEPYVQGQYEYLKQAVEWSRRAGLKVMIDLHGAPGSQNGFDNSGRKGPINWPNDPKNILRTKQTLAEITKEFSQAKYGNLEALNEPAGFANDGGKTLNTAKQFYHDAYDIVRYPNNETLQSDLLYVVHDSFQPIETWSNSFPSPKYQSVALDTHIYTIFDKISIEKSDDERVATYCAMANSLEKSNQAILTFVGEFAPSPTDCANSVNHQPSGSRYDGTYTGFQKIGSCIGKSGSRETFSEEYKLSLGRLFEVQTTVYEKASGWIMWTFKAENADDGSYDAGVKGGWIPKDPTFKAHGNQCN